MKRVLEKWDREPASVSPSRRGSKTQGLSVKPVPEGPLQWLELLGWVSLVGLALFFLSASWRKWPDPLIDFGRELYLPWRLAQGALLYRDVDDFYGPLSQYLNAALFRLFSPSILVLAAANLSIFSGIVVALYSLFRRAWGAFPAFVSSAIFISVFGFGQYVLVGNYNYATPYSHESTHGLLVCLLLAFPLLRWIEDPSIRWSGLTGFLFGLTAVLKFELMIAAGLMTSAAVVVRWRYRKPVPLSAAGMWAGCTAAPALGFAVYFSAYVPWNDALALACRAWWNAAWVFSWGKPLQIAFLGLDRPLENFVEHAAATLIAILLIAGVCSIAWLADRAIKWWQRWLLAVLLIGAVGSISCFAINWAKVGRCLVGLTIIYVLSRAISLSRDSSSRGLQVLMSRLLIAVLAVALMSRMLFNGRIYQYGFYQAALASMLVPAVMIGELSTSSGLGRWGRTMGLIASLLLFAPGVVILAGQSHKILRLRTLAVGHDADQFYSFPPDIEPTGDIVRFITDRLSKLPPRQTLVVLPEGEMINYLARMPSPVAPFCFYSAAADGGGEETMVNDLSRHPPDWIVIISRDLREYGIRRYGEAPGKGQQILRWVLANYAQAMSVGGDPLDIRQRGGMILRHKGVRQPVR